MNWLKAVGKTLAWPGELWHTREVDTELDLNAASGETLLEIIAGQRAVIADLQRRIGVLESRPNRRGSSGMPGNQPHSSRQAPEKKEPRKPRRHGFARQRMTPTRRVEHAVAVCPDCGTHLNGGWVQRTREVIELPVAPVEVTEHALVARICPVCQRRRLPKEALQGVVLGQQRLGVNLVSLMVTLREEGRLPIRIIQSGIPQIKPTFLDIAPAGIPPNIIPHSKGVKCGLMRPDSLKVPAFIGQPLYCQA